MKKVFENINRILVTALSLAFGGVIGFLLISALCSGFLNELDSIFLIFGIIVCFYITIIVHEGGHLVCGLISGYTFSSFRIGNIMVAKQEGRLVLRKFSLAGTGGQCLLLPPEPIDGRIPTVLYNLGGVIANFVLALVFAFGYFISLNHNIVLGLILLIGAILSMLFVVTNGIPLNASGIANDGMNAFHLSKSPDATDAFRKQLLISAAQTNGVRISDMPSEWFMLAEGADMQNVHCASLRVFAVSRILDSGDTVAAEGEISALLRSGYNIIGLYRNLLTCDLIYCRLFNNPEAKVDNLITPELRKIMSAMKKHPAIIRTEYTIALMVLKDSEKAEKIMADYSKNTKHFPYPQETFAEKEMMDKILEKFKNRK